MVIYAVGLGHSFARLALAAALLGILVAVFAAAGANQAAFSPFIAFRVAALTLFTCGAAAAILGGIALFRPGDGSGRGLAITATLLGVALLLGLAIPGSRAAKVPPIHDLTTDLEDPPAFVHAQSFVANQDRSLEYPNGLESTPEKQRESYPELRPLSLDVAPDTAYSRALAAAQSLGWQVTWRLADEHRFEATEATSLFRFVDDISVRIRPIRHADGEIVGSQVDVRSVSRVGLGDVGTNARRIQRFFDTLEPRGEAE